MKTRAEAGRDIPSALARCRQRPDAWSLTDVLTRLRRVLRSSVRHEFPWESLPMAQVEMLQRLADEPGLGVSELASRQHLATNTVSGLIQQMVTGSLVERTPRPGDRRAVNLQLSAQGATVLASWQEANDRRLARAMTRLSAEDQNTILDAVPALAALAAVLETDDEDRDQPGHSRAGAEA